jgi:hypothetical protein
VDSKVCTPDWYPGVQNYPWIDVRKYGAVGNGVVDDTTAIQAAINAADNHGVVFFPSGQYKVTSSLSFVRAGVTIIGSGWQETDGFGSRGSCIVGAIVAGTPVVAITARVVMRDIEVRATDGSNYAIFVSGAARSLFINVKANISIAAGVVSAWYLVNSHTCRFINCYADGGVFGVVDAGGSNVCVWDGGEIRDNKGFTIGASSGFAILNAVIEGTLTGGAAVLTSVSTIGLKVKNCYFEDNVGGGIKLNGGRAAVIEDNFFSVGAMDVGAYALEVAAHDTPAQIGGNYFSASKYAMKVSVPVHFSKDNVIAGVNSPIGFVASAICRGPYGVNYWPDPDLLGVNQTDRWISTANLTITRETAIIRLNQASAKIVLAGIASAEQRWVLPTRILNALKGKSVTVGFWAKSADGRVRIDLRDGITTKSSDLDANTSDDQWRLVQGDPMTVGVAATYLRIYFILDANVGTDATVYIADPFIYIHKTASEASGPQAVFDFETPDRSYCYGAVTWQPGGAPGISDGSQVTTNVTVPGAAVGQTTRFFPPYSLQGCIVSAYVSAANTVTLVVRNETGGVVNFASGDWYVETEP